LSSSEVRAPEASPRETKVRPLRILFVSQHDFSWPAEMQVLGFAQELTAQGHAVMLSIGGDLSAHGRERVVVPEDVEVQRHRFLGPRLRRGCLNRAQAFAPDVIHAWNPRVPTVTAARCYAQATGAPYFVHFEDDDFEPWQMDSKRIRSRVVQRVRALAWRLYPPLWAFSAPRTLLWAAQEASGLDALIPALADEVSSRLSRECSTLLPVLPQVEVGHGRSVLTRKPGEFIVLFSGRVTASSLPDVSVAIQAVAILRARGRNARLVQTGSVSDRCDIHALAASLGLEPDAFTTAGHIPFADVPPTLRDADVLVQPGPPSRFNRLRLPAKVQAYLASGTPVVSFAVGVGELLRDREEALLTQTAEPDELAARLEELISSTELREKLALGAENAARRLFDPRQNTLALVRHYERYLPESASERQLQPVVAPSP
jgi:glycosyltransferase involved in cell wall biosynthesis